MTVSRQVPVACAWSTIHLEAMQKFHDLLKQRRYQELREELARAELAEEISEFYVLNFHGLLAIVEGSEFASDYLEMAETVASSHYEMAILAESLAAHDLLRGNPRAAAERCLATLDHVCQIEGLWIHLLIALYRLGDMGMIDATLRSLAQLNDDYVARLVRSLSSEPDLREVCSRPAFSELMTRRCSD